ncbi:DUF4292 domain-containing protein [Dyadobacter chenwenxiniae]|uniref:DUF4292 domain-containing protein n=1 Tax=Dyadobacter chenwenxiniae TaxID=2906456 RepID=A0A9X1PRQ3_9BACT|nr:DUF4292 domain-containing protein [Dyadobacter chenwenxiniae]MCF0065701.1 DUF4292 domain-containing protein [Dyadobacter chenwenxiniae]UON82056.1 DUF4292 domain-containing protein [Dyadobacter chenwenxiniae]
MSNKITVWMVAIFMISLAACHKPRSSKNNNAIPSDSLVNAAPNLVDSLAKAAPADSSAANGLEAVKVNSISFDYLVAKSKVDFKSKSQDFDNTNINIRMKKDSIIWLSVTGVGFEVARGLITRDSIVFMDKIHKDYFVFNYEQLSKQYNFDLNFALLQSVIIGNLPFPQQPDSRFAKENEFFVLKQIVERLQVDNYIGESNQKLARLKATEVPTQNTFTLDYSDFKDVKSFLFPFTSHIDLNVKSQKDQQVNHTTMHIKHSKVDLVTQNPGFPFSVPASYKRKR